MLTYAKKRFLTPELNLRGGEAVDGIVQYAGDVAVVVTVLVMISANPITRKRLQIETANLYQRRGRSIFKYLIQLVELVRI